MWTSIKYLTTKSSPGLLVLLLLLCCVACWRLVSKSVELFGLERKGYKLELLYDTVRF